MFANRFTALIDSCCLVGALGRNTLLSLAEVELYRARWSSEILGETEKALAEILGEYGKESPDELAKAHVGNIVSAFPEGLVEDFDRLKRGLVGQLPDPDDVHVLAAAVKCRASVIVTNNIKDFPSDVLVEFNLEALTADDFIANTIDLSEQKATVAISQMRMRFKKPELSGENLLLLYEKQGFQRTVDILRDHVQNI